MKNLNKKFQSLFFNSISKTFALIILLNSCSGIQMINSGREQATAKSEFYSTEFNTKIDQTKNLLKEQKTKEAIEQLTEISDESLNVNEQASKYNLLGVIYFNRQNLSLAKEQFSKARSLKTEDKTLHHQILLNLAGTQYKSNKYQDASSTLSEIEIEHFPSLDDKAKYHQLRYLLAQQLNLSEDVIQSSLYLIQDHKNLSDAAASSYAVNMIKHFNSLDEGKRISVIKSNAETFPLGTFLLLQNEIQSHFNKGDLEKTEDMIDLAQSEFEDSAIWDQVQVVLKNYQVGKIDNSELDATVIGIVLPLSGSKKELGRRALKGIEAFFKSQKWNVLVTPKLLIEDDQGNPLIAQQVTEKLIAKNKVGVIIGGISPDQAKEQYLICKKQNTFFISLAPIYLPREKKNHLLIETSGSIQSMLATTFSPQGLQNLGQKASLLYSDDERGRAMLDEFWYLHQMKVINLTSASLFKKGEQDYRQTAQKSLGLAYERERIEEQNIWKNVYRNEGKTSSRRLQVLPPHLEFDFMFLAANPNDAVKIIPSFYFFDATKIKFVGDESWLNATFLKEQKNWNEVFALALDPQKINASLAERYQVLYQEIPRLLEINSFESMHLANEILYSSGSLITNREDLLKQISAKNKIAGLTSEYELKDNLWLKKLDLIQMKRGEFSSLNNQLENNNPEAVTTPTP